MSQGLVPLRSAACCVLASASIVSLALAQSSAEPGYPHRLTVSSNVQISTALPTMSHIEVLAGTHPTDASRLIACAIVSSYDIAADSTTTSWRTVAYVSTDSGRSWQLSFGPTPGDRNRGDPDCVIGPDGAAYFITMRADWWLPDSAGGGLSGTEIYRAVDGIRDWRPFRQVKVLDRPFVFLDPKGGHGHGELYVSGLTKIPSVTPADSRRAIVVYRVSGETGEVREPLHILASPGSTGLYPGNGVLLSDGRFVVVAKEELSRANGQSAAEFTARGMLYGVVLRTDYSFRLENTATPIAEWRYCPGVLDNHIPAIAIDQGRGPFHDRVYAVWPNYQGGRCQVLFTYTADKGKTWTQPVILNDDIPSRDTANASISMVAIAVSNRGVVAVTWYDRRNSPDGLSRTVRFAASYDGGVTVEPSVDISPLDSAAYTLRRARALAPSVDGIGGGGRSRSQRGAFAIRSAEVRGGESMGLAADVTGAFHAVWSDNRTGLAQLWTAAIHVEGAASEGGLPELAEEHDVSELVSVQYAHPRYDPASNRVTVEAAVKNVSDSVVAAPLKIRAIVLESRFGQVTVVGSDNGRTGVNAVWDLSAQTDAGALGPGQSTQPRALVFALSKPPILRRNAADGSHGNLSLVSVTTRVYGSGRRAKS